MNLFTVLAIVCFAICGIAPASAWFGSTQRRRVFVDGHEIEAEIEHVPELQAKVKFNFESVNEVDPDKRDLEYRVQLQEADHLLDLSCRPLETPLESESLYEKRKTTESDGDHLALYQKKHFPFQWIDASKGNLPHRNPVIGGYDPSGAPFLICQSHAQDSLIGVISLRNGDCQVYRNGHLQREAHFSLLVNPSNVKYSWATVANWEQVPESAFIIAHPSITEKRYIGKVAFPEIGQFVVDAPQNLEMARQEEEPWLSMGVEVTLDTERPFQVLVSPVEATNASESEYHVDLQSSSEASAKLIILACESAKKAELNQEEFMEELDIIVTKVKGRGKATLNQKKQEESTVEWKVFKKVEKPSLAWKEATWARLPSESPVWGGRDVDGLDTYICRYRCSSADQNCPSYQGRNSNGHFSGTIAKYIGYVSLRTGLCYVEFNSKAYTTETYDVLTNPGNLAISWTSVATPTHGTVVVRQNGEKFYIGRLPFGDSLPIGHVDLRSSQIHFIVGETPVWKPVDGNVSVLTVQV